MEVRAKDRKFFGRGSPAMDLEISQARGSTIWDIDGKRFIDFHAGAGVGILGWSLPEIDLALRNSDRPAYVFPHFYYKGWSELAELLATITPKGLTRTFRTTGGSEAVEGAMQIAMMYTGRKKFLSIEGSYHGNTLGALSLGASENRKKFHNLLPGCEKIEPPLNSEALQQIAEKLASNEVAAFFMEPVICNLGVQLPDPGFMEELDRLCKRHGTLLIMDEAITGFGRTGKFFASEHYAIKPDLLCMAKAMSAGYAGIGGVITTEEIGEAVQEKIGLYSSYGWHPVSVDASIATIRYLLENVETLSSNQEEIGELFRKTFVDHGFQESEDFRIKGMAIGLDLEDEEKVSEVRKQCLQKGLIVGSEGSSLVFFPALNIEPALVQEGLEILIDVLTSQE